MAFARLRLAARTAASRRRELLIERREHARVHVALEHVHDRIRLGGELGCHRDRAGQELLFRHDPIDDLALECALRGVARAGDDQLVRALVRQARLDDRGHARVEIRLHVDLGHAEVAAPGAHHARVVSERYLRAGAERVPVHRGDRVGREHEHALHDREHARHVSVHVAALQPVLEIEAVRVELAAADRHERFRRRRLLHLVERGVPGRDRLGYEAVLARIHAQHEDVAVSFEVDHRGYHRIRRSARHCGAGHSPVPAPHGQDSRRREPRGQPGRCSAQSRRPGGDGCTHRLRRASSARRTGARSARCHIAPYRLLFAAFVVNQTGFWISHMGLQGLMVELSHNQPIWLGLLFFALFIPAFALAPLAGVAADRFDRKRIMLVELWRGRRADRDARRPHRVRLDHAADPAGARPRARHELRVRRTGELCAGGQCGSRERHGERRSLQSAANNLTRVVGPVAAAPFVANHHFEWAFPAS